MISTTFKHKPDGMCLNFWYHQYGASIGTLNVFIRKGGVIADNPIWTVELNHGDQWRAGVVTINENSDFQVRFCTFSSEIKIIFQNFPLFDHNESNTN